MLNSLLQDCGLNDNEQTILLFLISHGPSLASLISKNINIKRPTVYAGLNMLINLGVVTKFQRDDVTYFSPINPENILKVLENRAEMNYLKIKQSTQLLLKPLTELAAKANTNFGDYNISVIESAESLYIDLENVMTRGNYCSILNPQIAFTNKKVKELTAKYLSKTSKNGLGIKEIIVSGEMNEWYEKRIINKNHLIKKIPGDTAILTDFILSDGSIYFYDYNSNDTTKQETGIKITHKEYYETMMAIFNKLWEKL